eukprot:1300120-Lingulodinium_polyedra.AAC.1
MRPSSACAASRALGPRSRSVEALGPSLTALPRRRTPYSRRPNPTRADVWRLSTGRRGTR